MWRISFWLFFSIGYIIINNSIKADFNTYRPNLLHFLPYFFQSTLPVRGATLYAAWEAEREKISIHAPRVGSDIPAIPAHKAPGAFQSTLPVWEAEVLYFTLIFVAKIIKSQTVFILVHYITQTLL